MVVLRITVKGKDGNKYPFKQFISLSDTKNSTSKYEVSEDQAVEFEAPLAISINYKL